MHCQDTVLLLEDVRLGYICGTHVTFGKKCMTLVNESLSLWFPYHSTLKASSGKWFRDSPYAGRTVRTKHRRPIVPRLGCGSASSGNVSSRKHQTPCVCSHYSIFSFGALASTCLQISLWIDVGDQTIVQAPLPYVCSISWYDQMEWKQIQWRNWPNVSSSGQLWDQISGANSKLVGHCSEGT